MEHPATLLTDQDSIQDRLRHLGQDPAFTYYVYIEGSSVMLINGPPSNDKKIGVMKLPSAIQIAYLTHTAFDSEQRQAAREEASKMYSFLAETIANLNRMDAKEEAEKKNSDGRRSAWIANTSVTTMDTKACECQQYRLTGDCWCDESCCALNGCPACL